MPISQKDAEDRDTMIVIGYLFVYGLYLDEGQNEFVPSYLQKHLAKKFSSTPGFPVDEIEPKKIEKRWVELQDSKHPVYAYWKDKKDKNKKEGKEDKDDKEVRDYCVKWGMWLV